MTPKTVDRILQEVREALGSLSRNQEELLGDLRSYALGEGSIETGASISYRIGFFIVMNAGHGPQRLDLGNKLMSLVLLRSETSTDEMRQAAAKVVVPSTWERLSDERLGYV